MQRGIPMINTILIVEDDEGLRKSIARTLQSKGWTTLEASNGQEAQSLFGTEKIDVILSDIKMPKMHGIELLHFVRKTSSIPFILMTGFSDIIEASEAIRIGADDFLPKPFKQAELLD